MAVRAETHLKLQTVGKTIAWMNASPEQSKISSRKLRRKGSKEVSIEMMSLAEEAMHRDPHELAQEGELEMLKARLEVTDLSIKVRDEKYASLLHAAASKNQVDTMTYLLDKGVPINALDNDGNTALHIATTQAHYESIHLLLDHGANDTILNGNQDAPLHIAVRTGNTNLVRAFLQHESIDLVVQGYRNRTPLHIAAEYDYIDVIDIISTCSFVVEEWKKKTSFRLCASDADNLTPLHLAARSGSSKVLRYMITHAVQHGYPIEGVLKFLDEENSTPLHAAIDAGHLNVVKVLLEFGALPVCQNGDQIPPFHLACYQGRLEIVQAMVDHCGQEIINVPSQNGQTPLHWGSHSINGGHVIRYLIHQGANIHLVDTEGNTALHCGIMFGSLGAVEELIKVCGDSIDTLDYCGRNAIHHAVLNNRIAILLVLLQHPKACEMVFQQDKAGCSPLHYALQNGQGDIVLHLVSKMKNQLPNLKDEKGSNYLHLAAKGGNWKSLSILLESRVSSHMLNETDKLGRTPLHNASMHGCHTCIDLLLSQGAMIHKCYSGYTPFLLAVHFGHEDCAQTLFQTYSFQREWTDDLGNTSLHHAVDSGCPNILQLCLDLDIPITRNHNGETFLDKIIERNSTVLALTVVKHRRCEECLDFPILEESEHPFLCFIKCMPNVAKAVLDHCREKSSLSQENIDFFEKYDFKYLRLFPDDVIDKGEVEEDECDEQTTLVSKEMDMMSSARVNYKIKSTNVAKVVVERQVKGMESLKTMLKFNRVSLLIHPTVIHYLKTKWSGYGRLVYGIQFLLFFLHVIFLSSFILVTSPTRLNISTTFMVTSDNITTTETSVSSNVLRFITLISCLLNTIVWFANVLSIGLRVFNIVQYDVFWITMLSFSCTYAFLIPWKYHEYGFDFIFWEAGAVAVFTSWFSLVLLMKPFDLFGVYVIMFIEVLSTLIKVLFICVLFVIAFAFTFFILVGDAMPFTSLGDSFFITFSYLLGEINYETYVRRSNNDALQYPFLTYLFVLLAAGILAVAVMNLLIGLAVGDIETIRRNAIIRQRTDEVLIFSRMDTWLPKCILQRFNKRIVTVYYNKKVSCFRMIWRHFWRSLKENAEDEDKDVYRLLSEQQFEIRQLTHEMTIASEIHKHQYEELKHMLELVTCRLNNKEN